MNERLTNSVISALIGGIVGAAVVFFAGNRTTFDKLEVGTLTIKQQATLLDKNGKDDVILRDGSVLANQVVLGKKFIGAQYQGHIFVGNRIFTSPDDLTATPVADWRFFTEMGSHADSGGELIVRSVDGGSLVDKEVHTGWMIRTGFDDNNLPAMIAFDNEQKTLAGVPFMKRNTASDQPSPPAVAEAPQTRSR